jgi:hypothetical protein
MGYVTTVMFYNDTIADMAKDPTFTRRLYEAISNPDSQEKEVFYRSIGPTKWDNFLRRLGLQRINIKPTIKTGWGTGSCAIVLPSHHNSDIHTLVVAGNTITDLTSEIYKVLDNNPGSKDHQDFIMGCKLAAEQDVKRFNSALTKKKV